MANFLETSVLAVGGMDMATAARRRFGLMAALGVLLVAIVVWAVSLGIWLGM